MDLKVNQMTPAAAIEPTVKTPEADGNFKFSLTSAIGEAQLQERLNRLPTRGNGLRSIWIYGT